MHVIKRNGKQERVQFDKITSRISKLAYGLNQQFVDPALIAQKCVKGVYAGVKTSDLDNLAAETAVSPFLSLSGVSFRALDSNGHQVGLLLA